MAFSYRALTCRTWKLNPVGCYDGPLRCKYSHHDTGVISPPAAITCFAWSQGTCALHEDDCLFAHLDTGLVIRDVQKVYLHGKVHFVFTLLEFLGLLELETTLLTHQCRTGNHLRQERRHRTSSPTSRIRLFEYR